MRTEKEREREMGEVRERKERGREVNEFLREGREEKERGDGQYSLGGKVVCEAR